MKRKRDGANKSAAERRGSLTKRAVAPSLRRVKSHEIADALLPKTRYAVLRELAAAGKGAFHIRELARRIGKVPMGVRKELERLESAGIVIKSARGRRREYRLNPDCPIHNELRMLILKTVGVVGVLRDALGPLTKKVRSAFVYGSFARGEMREDSDVDLMVIGDISFGEVVSAIASVEKELGREVNPTVYPPGEFSEKVRNDHHFLNAVLKGEKLFIIGGEDELRRLAEGQ